MFRNIALTILLLTFGFKMSAQVIGLSQMDGAYMAVKSKYAPDKRTAILDLKFDVPSPDILVITGETTVPEAMDELKTMLYNYTIKDQVVRLPLKSLNGLEQAVITLSVGNIRQKPDHSAELVTQSLLGTTVKVLKDAEDDWFLIQTPDNYIGWIDGAGIELMTTDQFNKWMAADKIIYADVYGLVYSSAKLDEGTISDITAGGILLLRDAGKKTFTVEFPDGRKGYIPAKSAKPLKKWVKNLKPDPNEIIKTAKKFMGVPYLWGGTSPKGMDCSGFTKTVYFLNGVQLARDASQQVLYGEEVDISGGYDKLKRGDLVFFGPEPPAGKDQRITHVGIYIGNKEFIHAAGMVKINSFDPKSPIFSEYRTSMLVKARRILTSLDTPGIIKLNQKIFFK